MDTPPERRGNAEPGEDTPLLSRSHSNRVLFRRPFASAPDAVPQSLPSHFGGLAYHRPSFTARTSDIDVEELRYDLARSGSVGSLSASFGNPYQSFTGTTTPRLHKSGSAVFTDDVIEPSEDALSEVVEDEAEGEEDYVQSKFINITPGKFYLLFAVVMLTYFVACFDSTLMASAHPVITSYFGASKAASWLSTVFLITSTAFQPLFGRFSDTFGRRPVYVIALTIFAITTAWCGLAGSIGSFIAARAVCGLGAGGAMSLSLIILSDCVRIEDRGVYQSHCNIAFGLGSASGAAFGGFLCDTLGWRWAFNVQVPLILAGAVMAFFFTPARLGPMFIEDSKGGAWIALRKFDWLGSALLIVTVTALILTLNLGGNIYPWVSAPVMICLGVFIVFCPAFIFAETRAVQPLMPMRLLTKAPAANLIFSNTVGGIATNTVLFNAPLFFQAVLLTSASDSGLRLGVPTFCGSLAGISSGYIITYTRRLKPTLLVGSFIYLAGAIATLFLNKEVSEIMSLVLITGVPLGQGFVFPSSIMAVLAVSEQVDQAIVSTALGLWRNLGTVLGIALSSLIFQNALKLELETVVTVPEKTKIISEVKSSVRAIKALKGEAQIQVIDAYAASLRMTFVCAVAAAVILVFLIVPLKLPRLRSKQKGAHSIGE